MQKLKLLNSIITDTSVIEDPIFMDYFNNTKPIEITTNKDMVKEQFEYFYLKVETKKKMVYKYKNLLEK